MQKETGNTVKGAILFKKFLNEHFKGIHLEPGLFYEWPIGLRFELGMEAGENPYRPGSPYIEGAYRRALALFEEMHPPDEEIWLVMDIHCRSTHDKAGNREMWRSVVKDNGQLYRLQHQEMPYYIPEDDETGQWRTHRWILPCRPGSIRYQRLIRQLIEQDMGWRRNDFRSVYFVHPGKATIFHVYDDRGCDLVASSAEAIHAVYERFNDWILDYDRETIDETFKYYI